jgi:SNF2 family DNA or RNA helicase
VRRDFDREQALVIAALARMPLESAEQGPPGCYRLGDPESALAVVAAVQSPPPGVVAEWIDGRARVTQSGGVEQLRVQIDHKRDWFGIVGELKVEHGRIELALLLDAARRQQRFVRVDANHWIELEGALRRRLTELADRSWGNELSIAAAPAIRALAADGAQVAQAPAWQKLADNLDLATKLKPKPPATLHGILRPYQREGYAWLARLAAWGAGACLADDMGLGKTIQAMALLCDRAKLGPALVLAPTSVALNWVDELRRFAPSLNPIVYGEATDRVATLAKLGKRDVLIVSYGLLARDADALAAVKLATLVADEAQAIKNPRTERAKAARSLQAEFRVALSGTPLENHLGELWSLFALVFPGLLGSWEQFRTRFAVPIEKSHDARAGEELARVIKPFLLRRTKAEVAPELPPRTEIEVPVALSSDEAELYEDARLAAVAHLQKFAKNPEQRRFEVLAALTRLRLLASHPKLYDKASAVSSSKMQRVLELVEELRSEGHRALVFSQFTSHLALVREELDRAAVPYFYLDGATPTRERAHLIARYQAGERDVFLISLKAGGTGINLTGADYVIHLDPWWNPAVEDQATDRAHRIGQDKPVTVYRLIARNTVEEKILAMHASKRALVAGVLAGTDAAAKLTTRDLVELLAST